MNSDVTSTPPRNSFLKPFWSDLIGPPWVVSLVVYVVLVSVRFFAFLGPFQLPALFFLQTVAMWTIPFSVLDQEGRVEIGLSSRGLSFVPLLLGGLAGVVCGLTLFELGMLIYGQSADNWCMSIRGYLHFEEMRGILSPLGLFALYAIPAIFLNPIGEEILLRGLIQQAFARRFHVAVGTIVSSILFSLMYLYIHGIWQDSSGFHFHAVSGLIALALMACVGAVFTLCRVISGSLWPAVAAHACFNLTLLAVSIHTFVH